MLGRKCLQIRILQLKIESLKFNISADIQTCVHLAKIETNGCLSFGLHPSPSILLCMKIILFFLKYNIICLRDRILEYLFQLLPQKIVLFSASSLENTFLQEKESRIDCFYEKMFA